MYSKKAQTDFMETFMVLAVIFILLSMGIYFFFKFSISSTRTAAEETCIQTSSQMLQFIASMPEIKCTKQGFEDDCIDVAKLIAYQDAAKKDKLTGGNCPKSISFEILYPIPKENAICAERDYQSIDFPENCNIIDLYTPPEAMTKGKGKVLIQAITSLYFPEHEEYKLARLTIGAYK